MWEYTFASLQADSVYSHFKIIFFFRFTFSNRPRPKVQRRRRRRRKRLYLVQSAYILTCCRLQSRSARVALLCVAPATAAAMHSVKVQRFGFPEQPEHHTTQQHTIKSFSFVCFFWRAALICLWCQWRTGEKLAMGMFSYLMLTFE